MTTSNFEPRKRGPKPKPDKRGRNRKAVSDYRTRQRELKAYMTQVTNAAERLQKALENCPLGQITLPLDFVTNATPQTLENLAKIVESQKESEIQQSKRRQRKE